MATYFDKAFVRETGRPLQIVAADGWLGGLTAMRAPSRPSVLTDGNMQEAPWITPDRLAHEGALVLWHGEKPVPPQLLALQGLKVTGSETFAWPGNAKAKPLVIGWGIIPPQVPNSEKTP